MFFFFKQKTAYDMRISDWSSDVCSSDLLCQQGVARSRGRREVPARQLPGDDPVHFLRIRAVEVARAQARLDMADGDRSEERRVGKECFCTCRSRWSPYH